MSFTAYLTHTVRVVEGGVHNASDPGSVLRLTTDQPLAVRLNASNASMLSAVRQLILGGSISALFLTVPGATAATVRVEVFGGGTMAAAMPAP
jgi:hypothetical protein